MKRQKIIKNSNYFKDGCLTENNESELNTIVKIFISEQTSIKYQKDK